MEVSEVPDGYCRPITSYLFQISRDQYLANRRADVRGIANPSLMSNPFWLYQVSPFGVAARGARRRFGNPEDPSAEPSGPVWCFDRLGSTRTELPDGSFVFIGGEHEDRWDPDFYIYNGK